MILIQKIYSLNINRIIILFFFLSSYLCSAQTGIWEELRPTNSPSPRLAFGMAEIGEGKVLIFGGNDADRIFDETWIYDFQTNTWSEIQNDIHPNKRYDHRLARITKNKVLLFGGWDPKNLIDGDYKGDTWIFDLETLSWSEIKSLTKPSARISFGLAQLSDGKVILVGGDTVEANYANDTWIYDLEDNKWIQIYIDIFSAPPKCEGATIAQIDTNKILFYGGWQYNLLDETWLFDYIESKWIKIIPKSNSIPVAGSSMANIRKNEVVFWGGEINSGGNYNEMWLFNFINSTWMKIQTNIKPDGRYLHEIVNFGNNKILLFGGLNNEENRWHNDTWIFTLQPNDYKDDEIIYSEDYSKSYLVSYDNKLKIKLNKSGKLNFTLFDIYGKIISEKENVVEDSLYFDIDISSISNGLYFLVIKFNLKNEIIKILINR
ncbi:MAG: hypothetical protein A2X61_14280 [Ignavibacteria bacterium GWB2_35_12]|nr:MAG: hypothetical protein A2X63_11720 [Ignavibacteria bacterium GWA2_35_8]OGU41073.1 MAG: hypothetical protein A2X61_14280 [Ignavibacteria bacterium GWB2_35_12]OGU96485.1 MAG: hypothetical protein A2220_05955 [Ignavibacteria bacterium RIFOXYA2_FULL_35_10]OGV22890.1 MAG: hypothetical protein A2475_10445 [Ignavibacteria bacterium RIFOXYC2_FULL_35_21]